MRIGTELLALIERVAGVLDLPPITDIYMPEPNPHGGGETEFGIVLLADGSAGLYYAWLGETQQGMETRFAGEALIGKSPVTLARWYERNSDAERSLALAAMNAITAHVFKRARYHPQTAFDSMGNLCVSHDDHLGMIGNFPSLVTHARENQIRLTVCERKVHMVDDDGLITITLAPEALRSCNKIISTAATLINDSLDDMLPYCSNADSVVVIGPTAGFFPDPLFARGIVTVGGSEIVLAGDAITNLKADRGLGSSARRYVICSDDYPGIDALLKSSQA